VRFISLSSFLTCCFSPYAHWRFVFGKIRCFDRQFAFGSYFPVRSSYEKSKKTFLTNLKKNLLKTLNLKPFLNLGFFQPVQTTTVSECCLIKLLPYGFEKYIYLYFSIGNGQPQGTSTVPVASAHFRSISARWRQLLCGLSLSVLVVVTFFNHNFVNCKATLIVAIKMYEIKIQYKPK